MALAENIRERRTQKGMTMEELAGIVGVSKVMIHKYEQGEKLPELYNAIRLAKALNTTVEALASNHEKENDSDE